MNKSSNEHYMMENVDEYIDSYLHSIERVPAPPFLITRIRERLANHVEKVSRAYVLAGGLSLCVLFLFNFMVVSKTGAGRSKDDRHVLANSIGYLSDNNIYR